MKKALGSLVAGGILVIGIRAHAEPSAKTAHRAPRVSASAKHVHGSTRPARAPQLEPLPLAPRAAAGILFSSADRDGDGRVSYAEFGAAARESVARRARTRLRQLDRDRDGVCTRSEVNKMSQARFARFDLDRNGSFSEQELATVMQRELDASLGRFYAALDRDHDAHFSVAELTPRSKPAAHALAKHETPKRKGAGLKAGELASRSTVSVY